MTIRNWSTTASSNNSAPPNGSPEGQSPGSVNNVIRQVMAEVRDTFEQLPFLDYGHTATRLDADTFTVPTDLTALYTAGKALKLVGATTEFVTIESSSYSAPDTTVEVTGTVPTSLTTVSLGVPGSQTRYDITPAEQAALVTPVNYHLLPGDPERYQENTTPGTTDMAAGLEYADLQSQEVGGAPIRPTSLLHIGTATTINGQFEAPSMQVFTGTSLVSFVAGSCREVNPVWWGASPSASNTTNSTAINASLTALPASNQSWRLPEGLYLTNATISVPDLSYHTIRFDGVIKNTGGNTGITFNDVLYSEVWIREVYRDLETPTAWATADKFSVLFTGFVQNCKSIHIGITAGHWAGVGFVVPDAASVDYNTFHLGRMINAKYPFYVKTTAGAGDSYMSDNTIVGLSTNNSSGLAGGGTGDWAIYFDPASGGNPCNNNRLLMASIEAVSNGIYARNTNGTYIDPVRFESITGTHLDITATTGFMMTKGYGDPEFDAMTMVIPSSARGYVFLNTNKATGSETNRSFTVEAGHGGLSFQIHDTRALANLYYDYTTTASPRFESWQQSSYTQNLNKQHESSGAPTSGTWAEGAVVWNTNRASGQVCFYTCSVYGTAGTLNGGATTASTTDTYNDIVVSSATGIVMGCILTVAGGAGFTKRTVTGISGTTITLSGAAASATTAGQAVSFGNPTFINGPSYP
jgi:hypothetical protein